MRFNHSRPILDAPVCQLLLLLTFTTAISAETITIPDSAWQTWSPREEIAPIFRRDAEFGRTKAGSLNIETKGMPAAFGAWQTVVTNFTPGKTYRFEAWYRTAFVKDQRRSVIPRLLWQNARGQQLQPPLFAAGKLQPDKWIKVEYFAPAPPDATQLEIQLGFGFEHGGFVWFDDITLTEEPNPPQRVVRATTIHHRPRGNQSAAENVEEFGRFIDEAAAQHPDIICLPEGITQVGTRFSYVEVSEPVPGPTTKRLGELAAKHRTWIVAGLYERMSNAVFNTAVLINREGQLAGMYRKTHLPREEWEAGLTPGNDYPVFNTDFGKVGLIVCWEVQFPEPARAMALKGAELLLLPIWGGSEVLARARAIENHVFLVSSTYDMRSFVVDPTGAVLAEATNDSPIATAEIRLDHQFLQPWLGDMKHRTWKERRPDIPVE